MGALFSILLIFSGSQYLECAPAKIMNVSSESWNERDSKEFDRAKDRCRELYVYSPCMKSFIKKEPLVYRVVCTKLRGK